MRIMVRDGLLLKGLKGIDGRKRTLEGRQLSWCERRLKIDRPGGDESE